MYKVALKMLMGDRGKFLGIVMGLTFASLLITQQSSIFLGLMTRSYSFIADTSYPDIWIMDPEVKFVDDNVPMQETALSRARGVPGIVWAVPFYKGNLRVKQPQGGYQVCNVFGLDDATLIGGPAIMHQGRLEDLRQQDAVIVNKAFWDGLPANIRATLDKAMADTTVFERKIAQEENDEALAKVKASGYTQIYTLPYKDRVVWQQALLPVHKEFEEKIGRDMIQAAYNVAAQVEKEKASQPAPAAKDKPGPAKAKPEKK